MTRQTSPTYRSTAKLKVCKETFLPKCCYQMRIGYITCVIYNTPDNLRIALEDNLIEKLGQKLVLTFHGQATDKLPTGYRHITNSRPTVGRQVAYISGKTCRPSVGQLSADRRPTVGRLSADS